MCNFSYLKETDPVVFDIINKEVMRQHRNIELIASENDPPPVLTDERKAVIFKKTADKFLMVLENAITDAHYLGQIDQEYYNQIKQKVIDLEKFVVAN